MIATNAYTTQSFTPSSWEETADGFLRVKARVLAERVMPYGFKELVDVPEELGTGVVNMLVDRSSMTSAESLRTLEGVPVVAPDHIWVTPDNAQVSKGNTAGAPYIEGPYLTVDLLITDPQTISDIKERKLGEISAGYHAESIYEEGEFDGQPFQARQVGIRYNHIAVIPYGHGRAGQDVRILNAKQPDTGGKQTMRIKLRNTGKYINVDDEAAVGAIEEENGASEESSKTLEETMSQLEAKNGELSALEAEMEELRGELSVYKEKMDQLLSEETIEAAATEMVEESGEADEIIENACAGMKPEDAEKIKNSIKGLHGQRLYRATLLACNVKVDAMSSEAVRGAFKAHSQIIRNGGTGLRAKTVAGAGMFKNTVTDGAVQPVQRSSMDRLGFPAK